MAKKKSSRRWLKEHFDDPFVKRAQAEGYRGRAVYKLAEIDARDALLRPGITVVDLGAAPGAWSQYVAGRLRDRVRLFALDVLPMEPLPGVSFVQGDFRDDAVLAELRAQLGEQPVDLVLSDMSPNISGMKAVDQPRAMHLAELALELAREVLRPGGDLLVKVFQGEGFDDYLRALRDDFERVLVRKPEASRGRSREVYLLARNYQLV